MFSLPVFIIFFREFLEIFIIISILITYLKKTNQYELYKRYIIYGSILGILLSSLIAGIVIALHQAYKQELYKVFGHYYEGIMSYIASLIITIISLSLLKTFYFCDIHDKIKQIENRFADTIMKSRGYVLLAVLITILREGVEIIIFLFGGGLDEPLNSIILSSIIGLFLALLVFYCLLKGGKLLSFQRIIIISSIFLLFTSAGMTMYASHEIQEEGAFGTWEPSSERSWLNKSVWDISTCCNDKTGFFAIMRSVIGYQDKPTPLEIFVYLIYWTLIVISLYIIKKYTKKNKHDDENDDDTDNLI